MKKHLQSSWMRVLSSIICTISIVAMVIGILCFGLVSTVGGIGGVYQYGHTRVAGNYALYAVDMMELGRQEELEAEFLEKGIACSIERVSASLTPEGLNETTSESLFQSGSLEESSLYELEMVAGSDFRYSEESLARVLADYSYYSSAQDWVEYPIERIVFDNSAGFFYYQTPIGYFLVDEVAIYNEGGVYVDYKLKEVEGENGYYKAYTNGYYGTQLDTTEYATWDSVRINDKRMPLSQPEEKLSDAVYVIHNISEMDDAVLEVEYYTLDDTISCPYATNMDLYQVQISWPYGVDTVPMEESLFTDWEGLYSTITAFYSSAVPMIVFSFLIFIVSFAIMIYSAKNVKEQMNFMEKIPAFTYSVAILVVDTLLVFLIVAIVEWMVVYDIGELHNVVFLILLIAMVGIWLALNWFQNIVTRIKCKSFWKTSEFYYFYKLLQGSWNVVTKPFKILFKPFQAIGRACKDFAHKVSENTPLFFGGAAIFGVVTIIEFIVFYMGKWYMYRGTSFPAFVIIKLVEGVAFFYILFQMNEMLEGSRRVASGDMSQPIDTSRMFWKFKEHGENINKVSDGIALAVEERMKSERFKTELITNVSHDIKTPLTSIINYVDLIKKEDVQDEKLQEYVEVLDRQSARLKKLIEDLMEASKASTGNLAVNLEECDLDVLLSQVIGEFEEKLQKNQLEVVVTKPDHPIKMMADGRHIWRVLDNLLNNACKYSLPNTRVYVVLEQSVNDIVITFKNISKEALNIPSEELLERFVRGDSSRNTEGSGLGLSIAQSLTELMHGSMKLDIDGDLFKVTLRFPMITSK